MDIVDVLASMVIPEHSHAKSASLMFMLRGGGDLTRGSGMLAMQYLLPYLVRRGILHGIAARSRGMTFMAISFPPLPLDQSLDEQDRG